MSRLATWEAEEILKKRGRGCLPAPSPGSKGMLSNTNFITKEWGAQGLSIKEDGDHVLELRKDGEVIARFSQSGVTVDNILKEVEAGKYDN